MRNTNYTVLRLLQTYMLIWTIVCFVKYIFDVICNYSASFYQYQTFFSVGGDSSSAHFIRLLHMTERHRSGKDYRLGPPLPNPNTNPNPNH